MSDAAWRGGLKPEDDFFLVEPPEFEWIREGSSFWIYDDEGGFGIPRFGIEAEPHSWENRRYQANFALPGGRVLLDDGGATMHPVMDEAGNPAVLGAGPLSMRCLDPWKRWMVEFDGDVLDSTIDSQIAGTAKDAPRVPLRYGIELEMKVPAFLQDCSPKAFAARGVGERRDSLSVGLGWRIEQLFTGEGWYELGGKRESFSCSGMRVKRRSVRTDGLFLRGHCWQTAIFPGGRAFGYLAYPLHADGNEGWNDGFIYQDGEMVPAKATVTPWLKDANSEAQDVSLELESELGITRIEGATMLSTMRVARSDLFGLSLQQTGVRYSWDGQSAYGMLERSSVTKKGEEPGFRS
ncbi:MAG: hypothetical protein P8J20_15810 [Novosphingobium sp.]|nr:hypothetical protein [Novosphingobium sp.]